MVTDRYGTVAVGGPTSMVREWYGDGMKTTIDRAGRLVVPKALRDELGFVPGTELDISAIDGHLRVTVPSRVRVEEGPHGLRLVADGAASMTAEQVRDILERSRR